MKKKAVVVVRKSETHGTGDKGDKSIKNKKSGKSGKAGKAGKKRVPGNDTKATVTDTNMAAATSTVTGIQLPDPSDQEQELTKRYRPKTLQQVVGLDPNTKAALLKVFTGRRLPAALLFTGPSGIGKTTIARMAARYANCQTRSACGTCPSCLQHQHPDVLELNAADTRGIDDIRSLIDQTKFSPTYRHRVVILDEVHQLTPQAVQALLKPVEEPRKHITWILCTTDPQKLLPALRGRCLQFPLRPIDPEPMTDYLTRLWAKERRIRKIDKTADPAAAISLIVNSSNGQMRDAVKNLELALMAAEQGVLDATQLRLQVFQQLDVAVDRAAVKMVYNLLVNRLDRAASAVFDADGQARQLGQKARYLIEKLLIERLGRPVQFQDMAYRDARKLLVDRSVEYQPVSLLRILQALTDAETMLISSSLPERHVMLSALYRALSTNTDSKVGARSSD